MKTDYDVIVIGGGGSGLAAAVSAAEHGADVLLLEKNPRLGGATGIAVGSFTANRTDMQRKAGVDDDLESHVEDVGKFSPPGLEERNNGPLRRFFLTHSADTLHWLIGMGVSFHGPHPEPPNRAPRMHNVIPNAMAYVATLQQRFTRLGGTILRDARATDLERQDGRVIGAKVIVEGRIETFHARGGVILATGDYANSSKIISQYKGSRFADIEGIHQTATGDGHLMADQIGAKLVNMDVTYGPEIRFIPPPRRDITRWLPNKGILARIIGRLSALAPQFAINAIIKRLLVAWQHPDDSLLTDGAILLNSRGERFCNETVALDREVAIAKQPDGICYILLDQRLIERFSAWPHFISTAPKIAYAYVKDYLRLRRDVSAAGPTLEAVCRRRKLPIDAVRQSVEEFNRYVAGKASDPQGRSGDEHPLDGDRWVLLGPAKSYFTITEGGAAVNERLQVLDQNDRVIEGLYAAGQSGLGGQILWGHGLHIGWALTSGRLAGRNAAEASRSASRSGCA